jgi:hypothetical protein
MRDCTVSVTSPQDGQTHTVEVTASSLFDAAAQAMRSWSMLWWYASDLVIDRSTVRRSPVAGQGGSGASVAGRPSEPEGKHVTSTRRVEENQSNMPHRDTLPGGAR